MTVLNRQMFQPMQTQPNTPVTPLSSLVRRTMGSSQLGEMGVGTTTKRAPTKLQLERLAGGAQDNQGILQWLKEQGSNLGQKFIDFGMKSKTGWQDQDQGEFAALIEKTDQIIEVLNKRVSELSLSPEKAAELTNIITAERRKPNPNLQLLEDLYNQIVIGQQESEAGLQEWQNEQQQLRDDTMQAEEFMDMPTSISSPMAVERQMGSPQMGEQANANNVGIMEGFEQGASDEAMIQEGMNARDAIDKTDTYDELMQSIRGDDLTEDDRRQELAAIVGEKDAYETPDSVLALVQPVIQMLDMEESQQGIGATDQAQAMNMPVQEEEVVGIEETMAANGGLIRRYRHGGPVQYFNEGTPWGDVVKGYYDETIPLYQSIMGDSYDKNQTIADILLQGVVPAAMGYASGDLTGPQAFGAGVQTSGKIMSSDLRAKKKQDTALKISALQGAIAKEAAVSKSEAELQKEALKLLKDQGVNLGVITLDAGKDKKLAASLNMTVDSLHSFYEPGTTFFMDTNNEIKYKEPGTKDFVTLIGSWTGGTDEVQDTKIIEIMNKDLEDDQQFSPDALEPGTIIQKKSDGEYMFKVPPSDKDVWYEVAFPVTKDGETKTKTRRLNLSNDEDRLFYEKILNMFGNASGNDKSWYRIDKVKGIEFETNIQNIITQGDGGAKGGLVKRFAGTPIGGEGEEIISEDMQISDAIDASNGEETQIAEAKIEPEFTFEFDETTENDDGWEIGIGADVEAAKEDVIVPVKGDPMSLKKARLAEFGIDQVDKLYELALKYPMYFGIFGSTVRAGKSTTGALSDLLTWMTGKDYYLGGEFWNHAAIDDIKALEDSIALTMSNVRKTTSGRSPQWWEILMTKGAMNVAGWGSSQRALDSLRAYREELVDRMNNFYDMAGADRKKKELPEIYTMERADLSEQDEFNLIMQSLDKESRALIGSDELSQEAIKAIISGADPKEVFERLKELKRSEE